jgi:putative phage-type endonuclease
LLNRPKKAPHSEHKHTTPDEGSIIIMDQLDALHDRLCLSDLPAAEASRELSRALGRSVPPGFVTERREKIKGYRARLADLQRLPVVEQRTPEWYDMRQGMMTASDLAQALGKGKFATQKDFFVKKAGYETQTFDYSIPPLKWGTMYEPVATAFYEHLARKKVHEFGLLKHPALDWFGCSPDGITEDGVMLEIKCPYRRKITGEVPQQYYYQVQGQLEVCGLEECDFLECTLQEHASEDAFLSDAVSIAKGVVLEAPGGPTGFTYAYSPWGLSGEEALAWAGERRSAFPKAHLWYLQTFNIARVYKDEAFVAQQLGSAALVWDTVLRFRRDKQAYDDYLRGMRPVRLPAPAPLRRAAPAPASGGADLSKYAFMDDE